MQDMTWLLRETPPALRAFPQTPLPRILIVDDEAPQMTALCDTLRPHGFDCVGVTNGMTALATLREQSFDLLVSDLAMPGMSGIDLLQAAVQIDPDLVGVIMTGQGTIATAVDAMKSGALDYILKPFKVSAVVPVLSRALAVRQLRRENAALRRRVDERTTELEFANDELEAFGHSVSHDLHVPLRAIDGLASILIEDFSTTMSPQVRELVDGISGSAQRMGRLIDDLLRLSRLGRQPLSLQLVSCATLVREVMDELRGAQQDRAIESLVGDLPDCFGDPGLLRQVFVNLLSNAFKFTRHRERAVVIVGCDRQSEQNVYYVRDNGAGFDMQYAKHLFGVFQRFHHADAFEGTGVGLSIVQRIVRRHGGRLWAEAAVDEGACFYFTLPALGPSDSTPPA